MLNTEQQQYLVNFFNAKAAHFIQCAEDDDELADMFNSDAEQCREAARAIAEDANCAASMFSAFDIEADLLEELGEIDGRNDIVGELV